MLASLHHVPAHHRWSQVPSSGSHTRWCAETCCRLANIWWTYFVYV